MPRKAQETPGTEMYAHFRSWGVSDNHKPKIAINPFSVASITEEGHYPPACTIETHSGKTFLVKGTLEDVEKRLKAVAQS